MVLQLRDQRLEELCKAKPQGDTGDWNVHLIEIFSAELNLTTPKEIQTILVISNLNKRYFLQWI